jgi:DNA-binding NarL/FixJ family response regulator
MSIKVLVADDTVVMRQAIGRLLGSQPEIELVGEAADYFQTIQLSNDLKPQVIVMDLHMPDVTELTPIEFKSRLNHQTLLLAISMWDDESTKDLADSFGAVTLLNKMELPKTLVPAILQLVTPKPVGSLSIAKV